MLLPKLTKSDDLHLGTNISVSCEWLELSSRQLSFYKCSFNIFTPR